MAPQNITLLSLNIIPNVILHVNVFCARPEENLSNAPAGVLHAKSPIICGVSVPAIDPEELERLKEKDAESIEIDGKSKTGYEWSQAMRRLESEIRKEKLTRDMARASGDNELVKQCNTRIKTYKDKYNQIAEATGISPDAKRMSVTKSKNVLKNNSSGSTIKKNNIKPITKISNDTINKISKVNIDGFTDKQNAFIQDQHKDLLKYARDNNYNKEVAFVFKKDLSDRSVFIGSDDVIDFGNGLFGKGGELFILHNHPRNSSFSKTDIDEVINNNIKTLSIVKNNGQIEIITKSEAYNQKNAVLYKERYKRKFAPNKTDNEYNKMIKKYLLYCEKEGVILWIR